MHRIGCDGGIQGRLHIFETPRRLVRYSTWISLCFPNYLNNIDYVFVTMFMIEYAPVHVVLNELFWDGAYLVRKVAFCVLKILCVTSRRKLLPVPIYNVTNGLGLIIRYRLNLNLQRKHFLLNVVFLYMDT